MPTEAETMMRCSFRIQSWNTQIHHPLKYSFTPDCAPDWLNLSNPRLQAKSKECVFGGVVYLGVPRS